MPVFNKDEKLFRKIPNSPLFFAETEEGKRISSAAFKDSKGCSVDRQLGRDEDLVRKQMYEKFKESSSGIRAIADVTYTQCLDVAAVVKEFPEKGNEYHCEIHSSDEKIQLTPGQAKKLANNANVVYL